MLKREGKEVDKCDDENVPAVDGRSEQARQENGDSEGQQERSNLQGQASGCLEVDAEILQLRKAPCERQSKGLKHG
jgi:hypothetical protein